PDLIRVVVADDHPVILFAAEQALLKIPGMQVVARARQSTELVKVLQTLACRAGNMRGSNRQPNSAACCPASSSRPSCSRITA
ncbi:hypothetical protein SB725_31695, partial [Pseudomonas sp. SIMBA_041]